MKMFMSVWGWLFSCQKIYLNDSLVMTIKFNISDSIYDKIIA